jgi:hypothetical protein
MDRKGRIKGSQPIIANTQEPEEDDVIYALSGDDYWRRFRGRLGRPAFVLQLKQPDLFHGVSVGPRPGTKEHSLRIPSNGKRHAGCTQGRGPILKLTAIRGPDNRLVSVRRKGWCWTFFSAHRILDRLFMGSTRDHILP